MCEQLHSCGDDAVDQAMALLRAGNAAAARDAIAGSETTAAVLDVLARADYLDLKFTSAVDTWERAYAAYRLTGDRLASIRVARTLAGMYFAIVGEPAVSMGWLARAQTLLDDEHDTAEQGWISLNAGMFEPDRNRKNELFRHAHALGRAAGDVALEVAALSYLGASLVHGGDLEVGMRMLDEALAAIAGDEVDDFCIVEEVFCQLFAACEHAHDVDRAEQWIRVGEAVAARRRLPAVSAFCRTHYGGVLTIAGRWAEADNALTEAARLWEVGHRSFLRAGALVRLAELRLRQGRFEEAEALLADLDPRAAVEAARPRAAVHLARGDKVLAREELDAALAALDEGSADTAALLELLVDIALGDNELVAASEAVSRLERLAERSRSEYVAAVAALARGRVCLATSTGDPRPCLRQAVNGFTRAGVPLESAVARFTLAQALASDRSDAAIAEARAALDVFEHLEAARHADAAAAFLRNLGVRPPARRSGRGPLTRREAEVLELLGRGLSNPQIAERLYISRKTVEHHVTNILAKIGLRSRAEAAAYAVRNPEPAWK